MNILLVSSINTTVWALYFHGNNILYKRLFSFFLAHRLTVYHQSAPFDPLIYLLQQAKKNLTKAIKEGAAKASETAVKDLIKKPLSTGIKSGIEKDVVPGVKTGAKNAADAEVNILYYGKNRPTFAFTHFIHLYFK